MSATEDWSKAIRELPMRELTRYVLGFAFIPRKGWVLIRKNRPEWQAGKLNGVGGKIEQGETPEQAMAREFQEETGYWLTPTEWRICGQCIGKDFTIDVFGTVLSEFAIVETTTDEEIVMRGRDGLGGEDVLPHVEALVHCCMMRIGPDRAAPYFTFHY